MRKLLIIFALIVGAGMQTLAQDWKIRLKNIRYYGCYELCGDEHPVLVKVGFVSNIQNPENLSVVVRHSQDVTYTSVVKDFDNQGNIYYDFCSQVGQKSMFDIYFQDSNGNRSPIFSIFAMPDEKH